MSERHHLALNDRGNVFDECQDVIGPLRPRVDVPALARALAVAAKVNSESSHAVVRHALGESLVPPRMLSEAVHHSERDGCASVGPGAVLKLDAAGGLY